MTLGTAEDPARRRVVTAPYWTPEGRICHAAVMLARATLSGVRCIIASVSIVSSAAGALAGEVAPAAAGHGALHLAVHDVGISFGNAPRVHGLRLNWCDRGLERIDGLGLTAIALDENPGSAVHGIAINLLGGAYRGGLGREFGLPSAAWVAQVDGLALSPISLDVGRSRGIVVSGLATMAEQTAGIAVAGLGMEIGSGAGAQIGGLAVLGKGPLTGITVAGLVASSDGPLTGVNVGGVLRGSDLRGINVGFGAAAARVLGLTTAAFVFGDAESGVSGITAAAVIGSPPVITMHPEPTDVRGLSVAAVIEADDLVGLSVGGYEHVTGVQRGVTIGLVNDARTLHGVQLGVLNIARNNSGAFRFLPILNAHFGP